MIAARPGSDDMVPGTRTFRGPGRAYDAFMGRYSRALAVGFADTAGVSAGTSALDVGCGTGALTGVLVERLGAAAVAACDPSPSFAEECSGRYPDVNVRPGRAEAIPFDENAFDVALSQLVLPFVSDPARAAQEMRRVVRPGGTVAACVWDSEGNMQMLRHFWDAALTVDPDAPDEAQTLRFGRPGEIAELFDSVGVDDLSESTLAVTSTYTDFDELWSGFLAGIGPAGSYLLGLPEDSRAGVRSIMFRRLGSPAGSLTLDAVARCGVGRAPG